MRVTKTEAKRQAYNAAIRIQPKASNRQANPRWIRHRWSDEQDRLISRWMPGAMPRPGLDWHREGSIDEIEQRENAGQRSLF